MKIKDTMLQKVMWTAFSGTFEKALGSELSVPNSKQVMKAAHKQYKAILLQVDELDRGSRFLFNILNCAMFTAHAEKIRTICRVSEKREM